MTSYNAGFTQLVRKGRRAHWGNWALSTQIRPGAVGVVDPETGEFTLVQEQLPGADGKVSTRQQSSRWELMSEHVSRQQANASLDGSAVDPDTGTKITAGMQISWGLEKSGSMISEFSIGSEAVLDGYGALVNSQFDWLQQQAASQGMSRNGGGITQGFGVITSVIWANSGLNVAAQSDNTTFSITGSVSGVNELVGQAEGKGSYTSTDANKSVDKHVWPDQASKVAPSTVPIAFTFASFDGRRLIPNWTSNIGSFQLVLNNQHGGTYIVKADLTYDSASGRKKESTSVSGGLISTLGAIPLDATNVDLTLAFKGVFSDEHKRFHWDTPLGTWYDGTRHIDLSGVWPGSTNATDAEAALRP
jgi:hypothetical protein